MASVRAFELIYDEKLDIPQTNFKDLKLNPPFSNGAYIFNIKVEKEFGLFDTIDTFVVDLDNFKKLQSNVAAIKMQKGLGGFNKITKLMTAKVSNSSVAFLPPDNKTYFLILDNTGSQIFKRSLRIQGYWLSAGSPLLNLIINALKDKSDILKLLNDTLNATAEKMYANACNNLRSIILVLSAEKASETEKKEIFAAGRTPNVGKLKNALAKTLSDDAVGLIMQTWSFLSERSHIEKTGGKEPSPTEVTFGFNLTLAVIGYLLEINRNV